MSRGPTPRAAVPHSSTGEGARSQLPECTSTIHELPNELLASVFQQLPWWDRPKMEAVCHRWRGVAKLQGWTDVGGYSIDPDQSVAAHSAALAQCGNQVQSLKVLVANEHLLRLCPNIRHLRLVDVELTEPMGEAMRELYALRIKSLSHDNIGLGWSGWTRRNGGEIRVLNAFLDAASANLEFLRVNCIYNHRNIHFPDQLRCLQLRTYESTRRLLTELDDRRQFPRLRSLELGHINAATAIRLSALQHVPNLQHLALDIEQRIYDESSIINSLPRLKSLVIRGGSPRLLTGLLHTFPQLEHLGWTFSAHSSEEGRFQASALANLAGLAHLRSLQIDGLQQSTYNWNWNWLDWLVDRGQLEHLDLSHKPPAHLIYKAIRKCPGLHTICADGIYSATKLAAASAEAEKALSKGAPLRVIYCCLDIMKSTRTKGCGRVRFVDWKAPESHVLRHYRYGCLSDGKPKWKKMR